MPLPQTVVNEIEIQAAQAQTRVGMPSNSGWLTRLVKQIIGQTLEQAEPHLKPARVVVRTIDHLKALPDKTVLLTSAQSVAQVTDDEDGHYLRYMGTDEADSLDTVDLWWNKMSRHTLTLILPAVIIHP